MNFNSRNTYPQDYSLNLPTQNGKEPLFVIQIDYQMMEGILGGFAIGLIYPFIERDYKNMTSRLEGLLDVCD